MRIGDGVNLGLPQNSENLSSEAQPKNLPFNPKLSSGARTEAKEAEIFSTQKAQRMVIPFARFLRKKMSRIFRRIPRPNENFGFITHEKSAHSRGGLF